MNNLSERIKKGRVIAVLDAMWSDEAIEIAKACRDGGISLIEIMMNSDHSLRVLEQISGFDDVIAGCGTVLDVETAESARNAGANFVVSPHSGEDIIEFSNSNKLFVVSGAATSSEIVNAWKLGADMVKVFPASHLGGPPYISALRKPLGFIDYMATGGINRDNILDYFSSGVSLVGISGALFDGKKDVKLKEVRKNAEIIMKMVNEFFI